MRARTPHDGAVDLDDEHTERHGGVDDEETRLHGSVSRETITERHGSPVEPEIHGAKTVPPTTDKHDTVFDLVPFALSPGDDLAVAEKLGEEVGPMALAARYERVGSLGEGGMGEVAVYLDKLIGRRVALKKLQEHVADSAARARFLREARVQAQLEHPSIVPVYDLGADPMGQPFFTMQRVRGETLASIIEDLLEGDPAVLERWSPRRLLTAFSSVCLAVDFAHRRGILHRDLKPSNVMLGDFGEVYVLDWGLSRVSDATRLTVELQIESPGMTVPKTVHGVLLGTPGYMAPEQMRGQHRDLGPPADVYSLGATLFELLTLQELHPRTSTADIHRSTLNGVEARASVRCPQRRISPELESIIVRAVALEPADRYPTARALHEAIETFLDGERDISRQRELAAAHASAAARATGGAASEDERRNAMRAIGRALALDPHNLQAAYALQQVLKAPPEHLPKEVAHALEVRARERVQEAAKVGAIGYASLILYLPFIAWMGVIEWGAIALMFVLTALAAGVSLGVARFGPAPAGLLVALFFSTAAMASTGMLFGALLVTPMFIAINTTAYALMLEELYRILAVLLGLAFLVVSVALTLSGGMLASYTFGPEGFTITPGAVSLPAVPTVVFLVLTAVSIILTPTILVARLRRTLDETERRAELYAWHLRSLVPAPRQLSPDENP